MLEDVGWNSQSQSLSRHSGTRAARSVKDVAKTLFQLGEIPAKPNFLMVLNDGDGLVFGDLTRVIAETLDAPRPRKLWDAAASRLTAKWNAGPLRGRYRIGTVLDEQVGTVNILGAETSSAPCPYQRRRTYVRDTPGASRFRGHTNPDAA